MLVLTRKVQEQIHIGSTITVTVLKTSGKTVRLGISGPPEVPIVRAELKRKPLDRVQRRSPAAAPKVTAGGALPIGGTPCPQSLLTAAR
jgi:carbon storage regulator CsrA